jgi:hypothetical protein
MVPLSIRRLLPGIAAVLLVACAPARTATPVVGTIVQAPSAPPGATSASRSVTAVVAESVNGISFDRPATWARWQPNQHNPTNDGPLVYLSTDPLLPSCATAPNATANPSDAQGRACEWPLESLAPNGVLVSWVTTRILEPLPTAGEEFVVNGARARVQIERPGACGTVGAEETMSVLVPIGQPTPLSNVAVFACLRGPDLVSAEAQFRAMLASARIGS